MRNLRLLTYLLLSTIILASCVNDTLDEATLSLSDQGIIQLPKSASEKVIIITTNQNEWNAIVNNSEWLEIIQEGTNLTLKATENPTTNVRKAEVIIVAGGTNKKIQVEQAASDATIVTIPDKLSIDQWNGTYQFDVQSNTNNWKAVTDANWIKLEPSPEKGFLKVIATENVERAERTAKILLSGTDNKGVKEVTILQSGTMYFVLPFEYGNVSAQKVQEFEFNRRSVRTAFSATSESYTPQSPVIQKISYSYTNGVLTMATVTAFSKTLFSSDEFKEFMKSNNYIYYEDYGMYLNEEKHIGVLPSENVLYFLYTGVQDKPYTTFNAFPYGLSGSLNVASKDDVNKYEAAHQGVLNTKQSNDGFLAFDTKEAPYLLRGYFFTDADPIVLEETISIFDKTTYALYKFGDIYYYTDEFLKLAEKEGFEDYGYDSKNKRFSLYKKSEKLQVILRVAQFSDIAYAQPVLVMNMFKRETPIEYSLSFGALLDKNAVLRPISVNSPDFLRIKK